MARRCLLTWGLFCLVACGSTSSGTGTQRDADDLGDAGALAAGAPGAESGGAGSGEGGSSGGAGSGAGSASGSEGETGGGSGSSGGANGGAAGEPPIGEDGLPVGEDGTPLGEDGLPIEEDLILVVEGDAGAGEYRCEREVTLEAVEVTQPAPFDVVIVADHSDSISWSREDLARGLASLLDEVIGYDARFFVLTPTQYDSTSAQAVNMNTGDSLVLWSDPATGEPYDHAMTRYTQSCTDAFGQPRECPTYPAPNEAFTLEGRFEFAMPEPIAAISREMTASEVEAEKQRLVNGIIGLAGNAAQVEQPVCTLHRYMKQARSQLPEHAVFIVISDEDDTGSGDDCVERYMYEWKLFDGMGENSCTEGCDIWRAYVNRSIPSRRISFSCVAVDDFGTPFPDETFSDTASMGTVDSCDDHDSVCNEFDLDRAADECGAGFAVQSCSASCLALGSTGQCGLEFDDGTPNPCDGAFEYEGVQYDNLIDYCEKERGATGWGECQSYGVNVSDSSNWASSSGLFPVSVSGDVLGMIREFQVSATNAFGDDGHYIATIVFDQGFECTPQEGQSYATTLRMLSRGPDDVFPICESYAPALANVRGFAETLLVTDYLVDLGERESIESVVIEGRDGSTRELTEDEYTYDAESSTLSVDPAALSGDDSQLRVGIDDPCARRVR